MSNKITASHLPLALVLLASAVMVAANPIPVLSDEKNYQVMQKALYDIRESLKEIKEEFPQLAEIDSATIKIDGIQGEGRIRLDYERGIAQEEFGKDPIFETSGCDIVVQIKYPATQEDLDMRRLKGALFRLKNGDSYAAWYLVRTEDTIPGNIFRNKANEIIAAHLAAMHKTLQ